ncbi:MULTISPECIES: helix-turn-helix domain-containing protein [Halorubrum]|uniref:Transcriptional regulator n=1 Tax=Halorubrum tropicale TaxID=1765655 RepID=A0A0M9ASR0_9EURY|nr:MULTISPECIES: helix-turn-helix domain-containing protein [Halorubrum]KOX96761.1 transcriptional regulator [Halorubrum tropicale]TKX44695.1 ArsR family transcriptional regulator [Halorubrum sp. ARQ200]TKX48689.1 ArsR family transcriptional regulator [Halorubrum sp. ASP121]
MKRPPRTTDGTTTTDDAALDATFEALADADCRAILAAATTPKTTSELAEDCDIALSTAYRKVELLSETPLFAEGIRFDPGGDHAAEYVRDTANAAIELGDDGVALTVDNEGSDPLAAASDAPGVSAD